MSLQDAATSRQEKLLALRQRKRAHESNGDGAPEPSAASKSEVFKFRNYDPETGSARKHAKLGEDDTVEKAMEGEVDRVIAEDAVRRAEELNLSNIQAKKPNWDLKRDLDRKLAKLKSKTDTAISQLIRKRLQAEKGGEGAIAEIVAGGTRQGEDDLSDEDE